MYKKYTILALFTLLLVISACNFESDIGDFQIGDNYLSRPTFNPESGTEFAGSQVVKIEHEDPGADIYYWKENEVPDYIDLFKELKTLFEDNNPSACEDSFNVMTQMKADPNEVLKDVFQIISDFSECREIVVDIIGSKDLDSYLAEKTMNRENIGYCLEVVNNVSNTDPNQEALSSFAMSLDSTLLSNCVKFFEEIKNDMDKEFAMHVYERPITLYDSGVLMASAYKDGAWSYGFSSAYYVREGSDKTGYSNSFMEFTSPEDNGYFSLNQKINFVAISTAEGGTDKVEFYKDGEIMRIDTVPPYSFEWSSNVSGVFLFEAKGYSNTGEIGSDFVHVRVNTGLYATLKSNSWYVNENEEITIECDSGDADADVKIYIDGKLVSEGKEKSVYTTKKSFGKYDVTCKAEKGDDKVNLEKELTVYREVTLGNETDNQTGNNTINITINDTVNNSINITINESMNDSVNGTDGEKDKNKDVIDVSSYNFSQNFSEMTYEELSNITNLSIESKFVKVDFLEELSVHRDLPLGRNIEFKRDSVKIDTKKLNELQGAAHITFYDVPYNNPYPIRNGAFCGKGECFNREFDRSTHTYEMDVIGFSTYSLIDYATGGGSGSNRIFITEPEEKGECIPFWQCFTTTDCEDGYVIRDCFDSHKCGQSEGRPNLRVTCDEAERFLEQQARVEAGTNDFNVVPDQNYAQAPQDDAIVVEQTDPEVKDTDAGQEEGASNALLFTLLGVFILIIIGVVLYLFIFKHAKDEGPVEPIKVNISPEFEKKCADYIEKMRGLGYEDNFIKQKMTASGYSHDVMEYLFQKYE